MKSRDQTSVLLSVDKHLHQYSWKSSLLTVWYVLRPSQQPTFLPNYSQSIKINIGLSHGGLIISSSHCSTKIVGFLELRIWVARHCKYHQFLLSWFCLFVQGWSSCITHLPDRSNLYLQSSPRAQHSLHTQGFIAECLISPIQWRIWTGLNRLSLTPCPWGGVVSWTEDCFCVFWAAWRNSPITLRVAIILCPDSIFH